LSVKSLVSGSRGWLRRLIDWSVNQFQEGYRTDSGQAAVGHNLHSMPLALSQLTAGTVLIVITIAVIPIAAIAFARSGSALKTLGKGQWAIERELPPSRGLTDSHRPVSHAVREAEIRQMVEAKAYRREARGGEPLDVEAEVKRLLAETEAPPGAGIDRELREEVRQLVRARNERRMRRGEPPLDVETEVQRQVRNLEGLGQ
jgi:hypothetical protein